MHVFVYVIIYVYAETKIKTESKEGTQQHRRKRH